MARPSDRTLAILERRNSVDEQFMVFSGKDRIVGNIEALASLALIGGRLDALLRRSMAEDRAGKRRLGDAI